MPSNFIGKILVPSNQGLKVDDDYCLTLNPKDSGTHECILVIGRSGSGKSLFLRVFSEICCFNSFTPIFVISRKNDFVKFNKTNISDIHLFKSKFNDWFKIFLEGRDLPSSRRVAEKIFDLAFHNYGFSVRVMTPSFSKTYNAYKYKLNPRHLDPYSLCELYGFSIKTRYIKTYERIFQSTWKSHKENLQKLIDNLEREIKEYPEEKSTPYLKDVVEYLKRTRHLFQEDNALNTCILAWKKPRLYNLTFSGLPSLPMNAAYVTNFIKQIIEAMMYLKSTCTLIFDDVGFFLLEGGKTSEAVTNILDDLINIEGRVSNAGIKRVFAFQSEKQIPPRLKDFSIYNKIIYTRPRDGYIRPSSRQWEIEIIDNDQGETERILLRPPVTAKG